MNLSQDIKKQHVARLFGKLSLFLLVVGIAVICAPLRGKADTGTELVTMQDQLYWCPAPETRNLQNNLRDIKEVQEKLPRALLPPWTNGKAYLGGMLRVLMS